MFLEIRDSPNYNMAVLSLTMALGPMLQYILNRAIDLVKNNTIFKL